MQPIARKTLTGHFLVPCALSHHRPYAKPFLSHTPRALRANFFGGIADRSKFSRNPDCTTGVQKNESTPCPLSNCCLLILGVDLTMRTPWERSMHSCRRPGSTSGPGAGIEFGTWTKNMTHSKVNNFSCTRCWRRRGRRESPSACRGRTLRHRAGQRLQLHTMLATPRKTRISSGAQGTRSPSIDMSH
jgi:hypothetical protein